MPVAVSECWRRHRWTEWVNWPHESLKDSHEDGCTEPWIADLLCSLVKASNSRVVVETGGFLGTTSAWLLLTLKQMGGGHLAVCEIDPERRKIIRERLDGLVPELQTEDVVGYSVQGDVLTHLRGLADGSLDFAFVDDDHHSVHVEQEILALWKKVRPGGIICFHDVVGSTAEIGKLVKKYGGITLDLPRLGPGGGLGIIQLP